MDYVRSCLSRRGLFTAIALGMAGIAKAEEVPLLLAQSGVAANVTGTWIMQKNEYGEVIRIDFAQNGTYRRLYLFGPTDITTETGQFETQYGDSVRLYNIRWDNRSIAPNREEVLDRADENTLIMRDSLKSALRRAG